MAATRGRRAGCAGSAVVRIGVTAALVKNSRRVMAFMATIMPNLRRHATTICRIPLSARMERVTLDESPIFEEICHVALQCSIRIVDGYHGPGIDCVARSLRDAHLRSG